MYNYFEYGLLSFAIAHIAYTFAFGFKPRDLKKLAMAVVTGCLAYAFIAPGVNGMLNIIAIVNASLLRSLLAFLFFARNRGVPV